MINVTSKDQLDTVLSSIGNPILIDFYASWCNPCKILLPIFESTVAAETDLEGIKIDVDANQDIAQQYNVRSIPTLILFQNGLEVGRSHGSKSVESLKAWVASKTLKIDDISL